MHVGVVAQRDNDAAVALAADVVSALPAGVTVAVDPETAAALDRAGTAIDAFDGLDLVVSIGGDGTFLFAARHAGTTPVLGVNLGEVGFLNAVAPGDAVETTLELVAGYRDDETLSTVALPRLAAGDAGASLTPAINEVLVQGPQRGRGQGVAVTVEVGGDEYVSTWADGVLVATSTGSTAYNLSEGGPLVTPGADVFVVTVMSPRTATRPLVVSADATVAVAVAEAESAVALSDGRDVTEFEPPATVTIERAAAPARVAGPGVEFFAALGKLD